MALNLKNMLKEQVFQVFKINRANGPFQLVYSISRNKHFFKYFSVFWSKYKSFPEKK